MKKRITLDLETSVNIVSQTWNFLVYVNEYLISQFQTLKEFIQIHNQSTVAQSLKIIVL